MIVKLIAALSLPIAMIGSASACQAFQDATIVSSDGTYLGKLGSKYDSNSIFNKYGTYGSKYNAKSIWNTYGNYGSKYNTLSAFNPYSSKPPRLFKGKKLIGYLTKNKYLSGAVDPVLLAVQCFEYEFD